MLPQHQAPYDILWDGHSYLCVEEPVSVCELPPWILEPRPYASLLTLFAEHGPMSVQQVHQHLPESSLQGLRMRICQLVRRGKVKVYARQHTRAKLKMTIYAVV
jgi:hypothetical protein